MTLLKRIGISWGLQAVNIISNREEDLSRGVDFFPDGWKLKEMFLYARRNLVLQMPTWRVLNLVQFLIFVRYHLLSLKLQSMLYQLVKQNLAEQPLLN
jgi:farnesyl-diphosphate farnesyltransferase